MTCPKAKWPTYVGSNPENGPGCGVAAHPTECLCDVRLPSNHPTHNYVGRLAFASLAEDALLSRGIDDPTTLQLVKQMLALKDAAAHLDLGLATEPLIAWQAPPTEAETTTSLARKSSADKRRASLREALKHAPVAVIASALSTTSAAIVGEAWNQSAVRIEILVKQALKGQPLVLIAKDSHMSMDTLRAILAVFQVPTLEDRRNDSTAKIIALAATGMRMRDIAKKLGVPHDTVRKIAYGRRGPLLSLKVRIDELVGRGWTDEEIHVEMQADADLVNRLIGASVRTHRRLDHLATVAA